MSAAGTPPMTRSAACRGLTRSNFRSRIAAAASARAISARIAFHQGRRITCRSEESVVREAELLTKLPDFKGYIHDVGGPTANFRRPSCDKQLTAGLCKGKKCLAPTPCPALKADQSEYLAPSAPPARACRASSGCSSAPASGLTICSRTRTRAFSANWSRYHVSGQLKVAPEHCSDPRAALAWASRRSRPTAGLKSGFMS